MTAVVTDIRDYIKGKAVQDAAGVIALSSLTDGQLKTRLVVIERIESGALVLANVPPFLMENLFPGGYDPSTPRDNAVCLRAEIARRGESTT